MPLVSLVPELSRVSKLDGSVDILDTRLKQPGPVQGCAPVCEDDGVILVAGILGFLLVVRAVREGQGVVLESLAVVPLSEEVITLLFELEGLLKIINRFAGLDFDLANRWKTQEILGSVAWRFQFREMFQFISADSLLDILIIIVKLSA